MVLIRLLLYTYPILYYNKLFNVRHCYHFNVHRKEKYMVLYLFKRVFIKIWVVLIQSLVLWCSGTVIAGLTDCTDFTTSQWSCALPLMSHQSSSAFFFGLPSGAWPFCFGSACSNPDPGPFLCSTWGWTFAHWAEEEEPLSSDVATTMARSVKIAADSMNIRSMVDVKIPERSGADFHP